MSEQAHPDDTPQFDLAVLRRRGAIDAARMYWDNLRRLGEPGQPIGESTPVVRQNIELASTAALVSIAESLYELAERSRASDRRIHQVMPLIVKHLKTMADEMVKQRAMFSKNVR
jgi:hypothetical protein